MLNTGQYEALVRLTMPGLPHISSCPHPQASIVLMARALAQLLLAQHAANPVAVKKCGREVWETLCGAARHGRRGAASWRRVGEERSVRGCMRVESQRTRWTAAQGKQEASQ